MVSSLIDLVWEGTKVSMVVTKIYFDDWISARNHSFQYESIWERLGMQEGFCMVHRLYKHVDLLIVTKAANLETGSQSH